MLTILDNYIATQGPATKGDWTISASHVLSRILLEPTLP